MSYSTINGKDRIYKWYTIIFMQIGKIFAASNIKILPLTYVLLRLQMM